MTVKGPSVFITILMLLLSSCRSYNRQTECAISLAPKSDYFLVILVDAAHLDYSDSQKLLKTIAKHPNGCKSSDVGHAWIYLQGVIDEQPVYIEGGHSGELGIWQPKYFEGVMNLIEYGYANPTTKQKSEYRYEPNPIKYLWTTQYDGFFQEGSGGHQPTFAARKEITEEQFHRILAFIEEYSFHQYSLTENQCCTFVAQVAEKVNWSLKSDITIPICQRICVGNEWFNLWTDPRYSFLTFGSPDRLEKQLIDEVAAGKSQGVLLWYTEAHPKTFNAKINTVLQTIKRFPLRLNRFLSY